MSVWAKPKACKRMVSPDNNADVVWAKPVEVRKSSVSSTWYRAVLTELKTSDTARLSFPAQIFTESSTPHSSSESDIGGSGGLCTFPAQGPFIWSEKILSVNDCIRERMDVSSNDEDWIPATGELCELSFEADQHYPSGWALAKVTGRNGEFFFLNFLQDPSATFTQSAHSEVVIVKKNVLRQIDTQKNSLCKSVEKKVFTLQEVAEGSEGTLLKNWIHSENGKRLFFHLKKKYNLLLVSAKLVHARDEQHGGVKPGGGSTEVPF